MVLKSAHVDSSEIDEKGTSTYRVIVVVYDTYYLLVITYYLLFGVVVIVCIVH